jgi:hypothetical protein
MIPASSQEDGTITGCDHNRPGYTKNIDVGKKGLSPDDYEVFRDKLLDTQTGNGADRLVGRLTFAKNLPKANDAIFIVDVTTQLRAGKITAYGSGRFRALRKGLKFAITGGTGDYNDARGAVLVKGGGCGGKEGTRLTFNLV